MAVAKSQILTSVAANVNGVATLPTGDEYTLWSEYLDRSNNEWPEAIDAQEKIKPFMGTILQSGTSMPLPADFRGEFAGLITIEGAVFEELSRQDATRFGGDYVFWGGNDSDGYWLNVSKALYSTSAVTGLYHGGPVSLTTLTSVTNCPDPEFLIARTSEYALRQRGQNEYVDFQEKADLLLQRMAGNANSHDMQRNNRIRDTYELNDFILGED